MKNRNPKLADVRTALSGRTVAAAQANHLQGGSRPAHIVPRIATPFIIDTDKP